MPQPNMQQMLKQVQKMQAEMVAAQESLKDEVVEASAGGGMVTVKVSGDLDVKSIAIDPEAVDPEDVELLQDMVLAAVNEGLRAAQELASKKLGGITGGLGGPGGGMGGLGLPGSRRGQTASARACRRPVGRLSDVVLLPTRPAARDRARQAAGHRRTHGAAARVPPAARLRGGRARARRRDPRGEGADRAVRDLLQPRRRAALPHLRRRASRPGDRVRRRGASDIIPVERTHEFHGRYHVLGGALSPIDGVDPEDLRIAELFTRVAGARSGERGRRTEGIREVVLATNPTTTGEATALHIAEQLRERSPDVTVTRLASGLPVGADLEYADELTLGRAFAGRRRLG